MRELSLFSGAGGGLLGSKLLGWKTIGYVEYEEYCQKVIRQRIADGILDAAPIFGDIRKFISEGYADAYQGMVDVVSGGFPCTDISCARQNAKGLDGEASGLWSEMRTIIGIVRPRFVFVENSPMLTIRGGVRVVGDLALLGYDTKWGIISAASIGANHERERIWIMAYANGFGLDGILSANDGKEGAGRTPTIWRKDGCVSEMGSSDSAIFNEGLSNPPQPDRMVDDVAHRLDRLKVIGNGQVPLCMAYAFSVLSQGIVVTTPEIQMKEK